MDLVTMGMAAGAFIGTVYKIISDKSRDKKNGNGAVMKKIEDTKKEIISEVKVVDGKVDALTSKQSQMEGICSQARKDFGGQIKGLDEKIFGHMRDHHNIGGSE